MGGDEVPTEIASVVKLLASPGTMSASRVRGIRTIIGVLELELTIVLGAENVTRVGVDVDDDDPQKCW